MTSHRRHHSRSSFLVLLSSLVVLGVGPAWGSTASYHRPFQWLAPDGGEPHRGLYLMDLAPAGMVSRALAETPGHRLVVLTETLDSQRGMSISELFDVTSGWGATFEVDLGVRRSDVQALFTAWRELGEGHVYGARLSFQHGLSIESAVPSPDPAVWLHDAFLARLVEDGRIGDVAAAIPEELKPSLLFLDRSLSPDQISKGEVRDDFAHSLRVVVEILAGAVRSAEPDRAEAADVRWPMEVATHTKGLLIEDPKLVELLAQFPGIDVSEPLADHRAADLAGAGASDP